MTWLDRAFWHAPATLFGLRARTEAGGPKIAVASAIMQPNAAGRGME
jgi:hypothetical protein